MGLQGLGAAQRHVRRDAVLENFERLLGDLFEGRRGRVQRAQQRALVRQDAGPGPAPARLVGAAAAGEAAAVPRAFVLGLLLRLYRRLLGLLRRRLPRCYRRLLPLGRRRRVLISRCFAAEEGDDQPQWWWCWWVRAVVVVRGGGRRRLISASTLLGRAQRSSIKR